MSYHNYVWRNCAARRWSAAFSLEQLEHRVLLSATGELSAAIVPADDTQKLLFSYNGHNFSPTDSPSVENGTDFGGIVIGQGSVTHVFNVKNVGSTALTLFDRSFEYHEFNVTLGIEVADTIAPQGNFNIAVTLPADTAGLKQDTIDFLLDSRVSFPIRGFVGDGGTNKGPLSATPTVDQSSVTIGSRTDGVGTHPSDALPRTIGFDLTGPGASKLNASGLISNPDSAEADLRLLIARDTNGDGLLNLSEFNSPVLDQTIHPNSGLLSYQRDTLPAGHYFANLSAVAPPNGDSNFTVDYQLNLSATLDPAPGIRVAYVNQEIADNTTQTSAATDFGSVVKGANGPVRQYSVTNTGQALLSLGGVNVGPGFEVVSGLPAQLNAGASATFAIKLLSTTLGPQSATVAFATNVPDKNPLNFNVEGTVTSSPTPTSPTPSSPSPTSPSPTSPTVTNPSPTPTATDLAISSAIATIPAEVVGGQKTARGSALVILKNTTAALYVGTVTVALKASTLAADDPAALPLGQIVKKLKLKAGAIVKLKVKLAAPVVAADASYTIFATATGTDVAASQSAGTVNIQKAVVTLGSAGPSNDTLAYVPSGRVTLVIPLINQGNVTAKGTAALHIFASLDGTADAGEVSEIASPVTLKISLAPGKFKTSKVKLTWPATLPAPFVTGFYFLAVTLQSGTGLTGLNTTDGTVVARVPFTVA